MFNFSDSNFTKNNLPITHIYSYSLIHEELFPGRLAQDLFQEYWILSIPIVVGYIIAIQLGLRFMRDRPKYSLRGPLFLWNIGLTFCYAVGMYRGLPEFYYNLKVGDLYDIVCRQCPHGCTKVSHFYTLLFILMKVPELLDTAFVILRKQPLFFLHWYHHCTVLVFSWFLFSSLSSSGQVFAVLNTVVHTLMYFYYSLKALSIRVPRYVSMTLTLIQLSQMALGLCTIAFAYHMKKIGMPCSVSDVDISFTFIIYVSYFFLFAWYFYQAYIAKDALIIAKFKGQKIE